MDPFCYSTFLQCSPIHLAAMHDKIEVVKFLIVKFNKLLFANARIIAKNETPLHVALRYENAITSLLLITATFNFLFKQDV